MNFTNQSRQTMDLKTDWKFARTVEKDMPSPTAESAGVGPGDWSTVSVPHDWAIGGPFDKNNDVQINSVVEDGIMHDMVHVGRTGGLPITGEGWYRKTLAIPETLSGRRIFIEFDGVMSDSTVFLNGREIGSWPFGYSSFRFELTDQVKFGCDNVLNVRVCARENTSRWYPGAGIYRHVRLVVTGQVHVDHWGTAVAIPKASENEAQVCLATTVVNQSGREQQVELRTTILGPDGNEAGSQNTAIKLAGTETMGTETVTQAFAIADPMLWDIVSPRLYKAVSVVLVDGEESDRYETPFGIRSISFDANRGFSLNGRHVKLKGVCQHHDLGALGAAVNVRAMQRQLEILQGMGCNAIRTSHNPPAPELLDLCDRMGFLVIDEAFDEWASGKVKNGYHRLFHEWAEKDLRAMIRRDRNHPCVIMWSIGNEIREQGQKEGAKIAQWLADICHDEDAARPVTAGFNNTEGAIRNGLAAAVDVPGWNYKPHLYKKYHEEHPEWIMYGSETASTVSSRGKYEFPAEEEVPVKVRPSLHTSSYDLAAPKWATTPDKEFAAQEECEFSLGEFVWTGFDYLGEPTPYREEWPSRSSYFGIVDLCGIPKDRYYLYQSHWSDKPVLHLLPHWNWEGMEGQVIPVHCYTSYNRAELFLNGKSLGIRKKSGDSLYERYRLVWNEVAYEPGTLKVVAYDDNGAEAASKEIQTSGNPARLELNPDRTEVNADGEDLCFITVSIVDQAGNPCPTASCPVTFTVRGAGEFAAADNGDPTSTESFHSPSRKAFSGKCMLIVRSLRDQAGEITVEAASEGLIGAAAAIKSLPA